MFSVFRSVFLLLYLLLEMMLFTSAALPAEETQRDVANRVEVPSRILSGAVDGAPEPPQDLTFYPQTPTSMMLTWKEPSDLTDLDHYVVYVEDEDMEDTTKDTHYIFNNLEACTDYTFGVMSVSAAGDTSDPLLGEEQTDVGPPPAPQNLQVDDYASTTVPLSWDKPDTLCDVTAYKVKWSMDDTDTQSETTSETFFTVTELSQNTSYIFTVSGFTSYGEGDEATVQQTTDVFGGGPPVNLVAVSVSSSAINVSWSPPAEEPLYYLVSGYPCMPMEDMVFGLSYLFTGMDPCESCYIDVTSYYEDDSKYTDTVVGTTDVGDPPPPERCSVQVEGDGLAVTWEKPFSDCFLGSFSIHWTGTKLWGDEEQENGNGTTAGTKYTVSGTVPYSLYTFEISSSIDGVFGSPASCNGTSPETQPGPPVILAVDSVQGKAMVTWETPVEENGLIVNYGIFVDEETDPRTTVGGDMHSATLELEPCKTFGLSVEAENGAGWGPPSEMKNVTVVDDEPVPPENCSVQVEESAITVIWERPDNDCGLGAYRVDWTNTKLWGSGEVESDGMNTTATNISVVDPVPYSEYFFNVSSSINGVIGNQSATCNATSLEAPASPPTELVQVAIDVTSVTVQWSIPESLRGRLLGWYLNWTSAIGHYLDEQYVTNPEERMLQIGDLDPSEVYNVYVMAVNGAGKGELAMLEASTEYVP